MVTSTSADRSCAGTRRDGESCTSPVLADASFCIAHAPNHAAQRTEARRKGGRNRATARRLDALMPARLRPVFDRLALALDQTHRGELDARSATALAALARAMVAVLTAGEFEERVRRLEEARAYDEPEPPAYRA